MNIKGAVNSTEGEVELGVVKGSGIGEVRKEQTRWRVGFLKVTLDLPFKDGLRKRGRTDGH